MSKSYLSLHRLAAHISFYQFSLFMIGL